MNYRILIVTAGILAASTGLFGQTSLTGKWQTDAPTADAGKQNPPSGSRGGRRGAPRQMILDLQADPSGKIGGSVTEVGNPAVQTISTGEIKGKTITLVTAPRNVTWHLQMMDDNTLTLTDRVFTKAEGEDGAASKGDETRVRKPQRSIVFHRVK